MKKLMKKLLTIITLSALLDHQGQGLFDCWSSFVFLYCITQHVHGIRDVYVFEKKC